MITIKHTDGRSAFNGDLVLSRQFYNTQTGEYLHLEAHEIKGVPEMGPDGHFAVAMWSMGNNIGGADYDGELNSVIKAMQDFLPDDGMVEMPIPEQAWV